MERSVSFNEDSAVWGVRALIAIGALVVVRYGVLALELAPLHFDEAQYWSYGEAADFGYYSKPPLAAWAIRASTEIFGDTIFGVRAFAPLIHAWISWLLFASGRRLIDAETGFWASLVYATLPGVTISSALMTTDPPMMTAWAIALYALIRALKDNELEPDAREPFEWWALMGAAIGLGMLAKYTMIAFVGGVVGYALFSRPGSWGARKINWRGPLLAVAAALLVFSPNLIWNHLNDWPTFAHVGDNAKLGEGARWRFDKAAEFFFGQIGVAGPVVFGTLLWMAFRSEWRREWEYRLLLWLAAPLPILMTLQGMLSRAHLNWAAPAYIAAALATTVWLLDRKERRGFLVGGVSLGVAVIPAFVGIGLFYASGHITLPRQYDPFKKMRANPLICAEAVAAQAEAPDAALLGDDRRLLANCLFEGGLALTDIAIWNPDGSVGNHYEMTSSLKAEDARRFILVWKGDKPPARVTDRFETAQLLRAGAIRTHADRQYAYQIILLSGFRGY